MLTWKTPFIRDVVLSPLLQSNSFSSPLMLGTSSARDHCKGLGWGSTPWLAAKSPVSCLQEPEPAQPLPVSGLGAAAQLWARGSLAPNSCQNNPKPYPSAGKRDDQTLFFH